MRTCGRYRCFARVLDSRSLEFSRQIRELTGGRGVDVVLNALSGEFIRESMAALAPDKWSVRGDPGKLRYLDQ